MADEPENKPTEEVEPEWAKNLKEMLSNLPAQIKEALTPEEPPQDPEKKPIEIPAPQPPAQQDPPTPVQQKPQQDPVPEPKPKKKSLLDYIL